MKKDFVIAVNYAKYFAFVLATVCVLIFQITGKAFSITLALSLYVVAFGLMCASQILHAAEVFDAYKTIKKQHLAQTKALTNEDGTIVVSSPSEIKGEEVEPVNLKYEMILSVIGSIFFGLFAIFTFVVLVLY